MSPLLPRGKLKLQLCKIEECKRYFLCAGSPKTQVQSGHCHRERLLKNQSGLLSRIIPFLSAVQVLPSYYIRSHLDAQYSWPSREELGFQRQSISLNSLYSEHQCEKKKENQHFLILLKRSQDIKSFPSVYDFS